MKHAFSSLISCIKHLLAYLISTLVERWCKKHLRIIKYANDGSARISVISLSPVGESSIRQEYILEVLYDEQSN